LQVKDPGGKRSSPAPHSLHRVPPRCAIAGEMEPPPADAKNPAANPPARLTARIEALILLPTRFLVIALCSGMSTSWIRGDTPTGTVASESDTWERLAPARMGRQRVGE
jgi:hypothetical protein